MKATDLRIPDLTPEQTSKFIKQVNALIKKDTKLVLTWDEESLYTRIPIILDENDDLYKQNKDSIYILINEYADIFQIYSEGKRWVTNSEKYSYTSSASVSACIKKAKDKYDGKRFYWIVIERPIFWDPAERRSDRGVQFNREQRIITFEKMIQQKKDEVQKTLRETPFKTANIDAITQRLLRDTKDMTSAEADTFINKELKTYFSLADIRAEIDQDETLDKVAREAALSQTAVIEYTVSDAIYRITEIVKKLRELHPQEGSLNPVYNEFKTSLENFKALPSENAFNRKKNTYYDKSGYSVDLTKYAIKWLNNIENSESFLLKSLNKIRIVFEEYRNELTAFINESITTDQWYDISSVSQTANNIVRDIKSVQRDIEKRVENTTDVEEHASAFFKKYYLNELSSINKAIRQARIEISNIRERIQNENN